MPTTAINFGRLLILIGLAGYAYGVYNGNSSFTAFIPAAFGLLLLILGYIARAKESMRKHLMHVAVIVGLLGFIMPLIRIIMKIKEFELSGAVVSQITMAVVCLVFVILCVMSFIKARKNA